jgi:hypothetical protein
MQRRRLSASAFDGAFRTNTMESEMRVVKVIVILSVLMGVLWSYAGDDATQKMDLAWHGFLLFFLSLMPYLLPSIVADNRKHHQFLAILMLNLFLGWTLVGWVISLVWACTAVHLVRVQASSTAQHT